MEAAPPLTGREQELQIIRNSLTAAAASRGSLVLLSGPAGIGKTRLLEEAAAEAVRRGFSTGSGVAFSESSVLYHAWTEALRGLKLDHLLHEEPPPRLLGLYAVSEAGLPIVRAERAGFSEDAALLAMMLGNAAEFLRDAIGAGSGSVEGDLLRLALGGRGVCIARGRTLAMIAVFEGRETEIFLREVRRLLDELSRRAGGRLDGWDGNKRAVADLAEPLAAAFQAGRFDGVDLAADGQARKFNLFDNVLFGLRRRSSIQPLLLILDDLQWAEASSLGLLQYVARNSKDVPILVIGAFRSEERETRPQLREALASLSREDLGQEMHIARLSTQETKALAENLIGPNKLGPDFFSKLTHGTEGNPLILREVVRHMRDQGALAPSRKGGPLELTRPLERLEVPGKIREAVANRLGALEREDRELLDAAAVCGTRFGGKLLAELVKEPEISVARHLNAIARQHGVVLPAAGAWRFDHPVVREVVYEAVPLDLRRLLHVEAAQLLTRSAGAEADIGEHFAAGGDPRAVGPLESAAGAAVERGAPADAARLLERAGTVATGADRARLEEARARALELAASYDEALASVDRAQTLGADPTKCALLRATVLAWQAKFNDVLRVVGAALPDAKGADARRLWTLRARAYVSLAQYDDSEQAAQRSFDFLGEGDVLGRADAIVPMALADWYRGRHARALELLNEALKLREAGGDRRGVCEALQGIGGIQGDLGHTQRAVEFLRLALGLAERTGDRLAAGSCRMNIANALADLGDFEGATDEARRASAVAETIGNPRMMAWSECIQGIVLARRGKATDALAVLERCARRAGKLGDQRLLSTALAESVAPRLKLGETSRAAKDAKESLAVARSAAARMIEALALRACAEVASVDRDLEAMGRYFEQAEVLFSELNNATEAAETHARWADALRAAGQSGAARAHWTIAVELFESRSLRKRAAAARTALIALPV